MKKNLLLLALLLLSLTAANAQGDNKEIVSTTSGKVSGIMQEGTMAFLGIPYAKVERFMPPNRRISRFAKNTENAPGTLESVSYSASAVPPPMALLLRNADW